MNDTDQPDGQGEFRPGDTISPRSAEPAPAQPASPVSPSTESPVSPPESQTAQAVATFPPPATVPLTGLQDENDNTDPVDPQMYGNGRSVTWTASEFIDHHKSTNWYLLLFVVAAVLAAAVFLLTKDIVSTVVVILGAILLGSYGARKPRQLQYKLDDSGLTIGAKQYPYRQFRSFAVVDEGAFSSIIFMPLKRFAMAVSVYYDPADEERIIDVLADILPMEEHRRDVVDDFLHRIRF